VMSTSKKKKIIPRNSMLDFMVKSTTAKRKANVAFPEKEKSLTRNDKLLDTVRCSVVSFKCTVDVIGTHGENVIGNCGNSKLLSCTNSKLLSCTDSELLSCTDSELLSCTDSELLSCMDSELMSCTDSELLSCTDRELMIENCSKNVTKNCTDNVVEKCAIDVVGNGTTIESTKKKNLLVKRQKLSTGGSTVCNQNNSAILEFTELVHGHLRKISQENDEHLENLEKKILEERESLETLILKPHCFRTIKTLNQKKTDLANLIESKDKLLSNSFQDIYRTSIDYISKFRDCTSDEIRNNIILEFESRFCKTKNFPVHRCNILFCTECNSVLYLQPDDGVYVCLDCGTTECQGDRLFITSVSNNGEDADILVNIDKKVNSFRDFLHNLQGKKQLPVVANFIEKFKNTLIAEGIDPVALCKKDIMEKLVATKNRKFSRFIDIIFSGLHGCDSIKMSLALEIKFASRFQSIIDPYERNRPAYRKHFLSYSYCAWQFCRLEDTVEFMGLFKLLKDRKKIVQQDTIFKMICDELNWNFESPLSQKFSNYFIQ
jgi:hypothetical protein